MEKFGIETKKLMVEEIKEKLRSSSNLFATSFSAIAVSEQDQLRHKLKANQASMFMVKNRIAHLAFKQLKQENLAALLQGSTAITIAGEDALSVSKTLVDFAGKNENFKVIGAYIDGRLLDPTLVRKLAAIPSKETLLAQVVGGIKSPIQGLVNTLSGTIKKFVLVIDRIKEKQGEKKE